MTAKNIRPYILQKVMTADKINATVQYYFNTQASGNNTNFVSAVVNSLIQSLSGGGAATKMIEGNTTNVGNQLNANAAFANAVQPSTNTGTTPLAYLTVLFFDERFKFIEAVDGGVAQQQVAGAVGSSGASLTLANIKAPKNGYAYAYVSNQSHQDVYFDNLQVSMVAGNIIEENHYYSYGLRIAAISSRKFQNVNEGEVKNNYLMQGAYSEMDDDIGWNDFFLRNYDPQIGRWIQQDPFQEFPNPYTGMGNDPVNNIDPNGGSIFEGVSALGRAAVTTLGGAIVGLAADLLSGGDGWTGAGIGAGVGLAAGLLNSATATSIVIQTTNVAVTVINTSITTHNIGKQFDAFQFTLHEGSAKDLSNRTINEDVSIYGSQSGIEDPTTTTPKFFTFNEQANAFNYMWSHSFKDGMPFKENLAYVTDNGILVLPNYKNGNRTSKLDVLPIKRDKNFQITHVQYKSKWSKIKGTIHTHPNGEWQHVSPEDQGVFMNVMKN
ncbi:MAG TPA: RHS repeat-associated core domain-containing protein, partial [Flavisolibacter sp.]|nr:RHS repeat-associated core domain-containing protein [Flavisolibacter sp.]